MTACPLCQSPSGALFAATNTRRFYRCNECVLIFVPMDGHLSQTEEKRRYALHRNSPQEKKYVDYLTSIANDALRRVAEPASVLDYGSGANHVLTDIFRSRGLRCVAHDPLYGMTADAGERFDLVVICEALEHFRDPRKDLQFIGSIVKQEGVVYIRTQLHDAVGDFASWWYALDPTHVAFYCAKTMATVAEILGKKIMETNGTNTVVFGQNIVETS